MDYLKEAFLFRWNLLLFFGGTAAAALTPAASETRLRRGRRRYRRMVPNLITLSLRDVK
jgi:hypothetical protein